jgi:pyruvate/2-oxoglutarate dehydrogenase complex dihydrolipoamide acyltransferase (E2) component
VEKAGAKLTVTAVITRVCAEALKRFPRFNASIDIANHRIILKRYVHIGIAADTPRGLLVPVIRDADQMSIVELAKTIGDLAQRARSKKIKPDEMEGGTFSISNQGGIGGVGFTPIVLWPQVAILRCEPIRRQTGLYARTASNREPSCPCPSPTIIASSTGPMRHGSCDGSAMDWNSP